MNTALNRLHDLILIGYEIADSEFQTANENSWGIHLKHLTPGKVEHRELLLLADGRISASVLFNDQVPYLFEADSDQDFIIWLKKIKKPNSWDRAIDLRVQILVSFVLIAIFAALYLVTSPIIDFIIDYIRKII
jgi:hypothetical protein